jgi:uncharacterized repeat protein (TIGR03803 family)
LVRKDSSFSGRRLRVPLAFTLFAMVVAGSSAIMLHAQDPAKWPPPSPNPVTPSQSINIDAGSAVFPPEVGRPTSRLIQASDGNFYGTTASGGAHDLGTIFQLTPSGDFTVLYSFCSSCGYSPNGIIEIGDGNFYGTTREGGTHDKGVLFTITPAGGYTIIHNFGSFNHDAAEPIGQLIPNISCCGVTGSTSRGGLYDKGTIFSWVPSLARYIIYTSFGTEAGNGAYPGPLVRADGSAPVYYGTTREGGANGKGTAFKYAPTTNELTTLYSFCSQGGTFLCSDGSYPVAEPLVQAADGNFYGTTQSGGRGGIFIGGTIFRVTSSGGFSSLYSFGDGERGATPSSGLFIASDGNFYGTTAESLLIPVAYDGNGTIYQFTPSAELWTIYTYCGQFAECSVGGPSLGYGPIGGILQGSDGRLYNNLAHGSIYDLGAVGEAIPVPPFAPPVQLSFSQPTVPLGSPVTLDWQVHNAFSGTLKVCYAFVQNNAADAGSWSGLKVGTEQGNLYIGSASITPTASGTYTYALTCGGIESGFATLTVSADTTHTKSPR